MELFPESFRSDPTQSSERVRRLKGTAAKALIERRFKISISETDAKLLAECGRLTELPEKLSRKLEVRHRGQNVRLSRKAQRQIAVQKLILDCHSNRASAQRSARDAIQRIIDEHEKRIEDRRQVQHDEDDLAERIESLEEKWPKRRQFFRKATRLRRRQVTQLQVHLGEGDQFEEALSQLNELYKRYLDRADEMLEKELRKDG